MRVHMLGCMIVRRMKVRARIYEQEVRYGEGERIYEQEVRHGEGDNNMTSQINSTMTKGVTYSPVRTPPA